MQESEESASTSIPATTPPAADDFASTAAALGPRRRTFAQGRVGVDGFHGGGFERKLERERRYGEVYQLDEHEHGCRLRLELARTVPDSALKRTLQIGDEMPEYTCSAETQGSLLIVRGSITDANVRRLAAVSTAFPPDFHMTVDLPPAAGWRTALRVEGRFLEVVAVRE